MSVTIYKFANAGNPAVQPPVGPRATGPQLDSNFDNCIYVDFSNVTFNYDPPYANLAAFQAAMSAAGFAITTGVRYYDLSLHTPRIYGDDGAWHGFLLT